MATGHLEIELITEGQVTNNYLARALYHLNFGLYANYYFLEGNWNLYLIGGVNMQLGNQCQFNDGEITTAHHISGNLRLGLGLQYTMRENLALFSELVYQRTVLDVSTQYGSKKKNHFLMPNLGLRWTIPIQGNYT